MKAIAWAIVSAALIHYDAQMVVLQGKGYENSEIVGGMIFVALLFVAIAAVAGN